MKVFIQYSFRDVARMPFMTGALFTPRNSVNNNIEWGGSND